MAKQSSTLFFLQENRANILAGFLSIIAISIYGFLAYSSMEAGYDTGRTIKGEVINYGRTRSATSLFKNVFIIQLENGTQIKIDDLGNIPSIYRGPVTISIYKSKLTGKNIYRISQQQPTR